MPIPASISELSVTPALNSPQGTESAKGTVDDYFRTHAAFIRQVFDVTAGATVTLPSATSVAIGFAASNNIAITGTTTITAFDIAAEGTLRNVQFSGALTLTHNAASMILPGAANIVTAAGDVGIFKSLGVGNWKCLLFSRDVAETGATIRSKLGIATLSGSNTGDQTSVSGSSGSCTGNAATATSAGYATSAGTAASCSGNALTATTAAAAINATNATTADNAIGQGQAWSQPARSAATMYTNSTGRSILIEVSLKSTSTACTAILFVSGVQVSSVEVSTSSGNYPGKLSAVIPSGANYQVDVSNMAIQVWAELR